MKFYTLPLLLVVFVSQYAAAYVTITTSSLPKGAVNAAYSAVIHASGGCTPYKWAIVSGALPAGITATVSSTTTQLQLTGKPTSASTDSFVVEVTGCGGHAAQASYQLVIGALVAITTTSLPNGTVNAAYSAMINASGGCTPYTWTLASGALPAGVTATVSRTTTSLILSGTPSTSGTNLPAIKVTGCGGHVSQVAYKVVIQPTANHVVALNWSASTSSDIVGYNVYRGTDGVTWKRINAGLLAAMLYDDSTVANGTTYYYATTAVDASGLESNKSASIEVAIP
jgi:hypothetical protein